ncbi:MAG: tRNA (adenosine(37)-N6)-threonylcarbamoyltransferase complex dimerization subunit type 1 TsaB [Betaproteobacteria bacterium]|nr:tRNA (adenosine(37)-N6)-threonylcarbamoyltransferase complex dimerization subunit type 1 TsaB [Betaproteobacteria bacterium]
MKILAFDTSTEHCSLALFMDGTVSARDAVAGRRHSEMLLPMVQGLLAEAGVTLKQLDGIAFGAGPGSFTGLRIACGVAQGLAFGAGLKVIGICTLEALAEATHSERVIACLDARMGEIYHGAYEKRDGGWVAVREPSLCLPRDAPQVPGDGWTGCGSGFDLHGDALRARYDGRLARVDRGMIPHAREMVRLATRRFARGEGIEPDHAAPLYVRNKVALKEAER